MSEQQPANLWDLSDLYTPWCLHVVATLRIAEHIAAGKNQIGDLAVAASSDPYAPHRVLTHLVGKGVFAEPSRGCFKPRGAVTKVTQTARDSRRCVADGRSLGRDLPRCRRG